MTLYQELEAAGCEMDHNESDLYVLATAKAFTIIYRHPIGFTRFIGTDGRHWLDLPFMYDPFWSILTQ